MFACLRKISDREPLSLRHSADPARTPSCSVTLRMRRYRLQLPGLTFRRRVRAGCFAACLTASTVISGQTAAPPALAPGPMVVGAVRAHDVAAGETLTALAARYGVDVATIVAENRLPPGAPIKAGTSLIIDNRHIVPASPGAALVVNVAQRHLFSFQRNGTVVSYPVAVGRPAWRARRVGCRGWGGSEAAATGDERPGSR